MTFCYLFKKAKDLLKQESEAARTSFASLAGSDPNHEGLAPLRCAMINILEDEVHDPTSTIDELLNTPELFERGLEEESSEESE